RNLGRNKLTGPLPVELIGKQKNNALELSLRVTNNFERVPYKGGFITVYHGQLVKSEVAMKMLSPSSSQGHVPIVECHVGALITIPKEGLEYLHQGLKHPIIQRDMKSTNILLNEKSRISPVEGGTHMSTTIAGTAGFLNTKNPVISKSIENGNSHLRDKSTVDLSFKGEFDIISVGKAVEIAMASVSSKVNRRPLMNQVVMVREQGNGSRITIK
ncbi:hypothetical protein CISIN_1g0395052mg, partial [Citrus sinensis]